MHRTRWLSQETNPGCFGLFCRNSNWQSRPRKKARVSRITFPFYSHVGKLRSQTTFTSIYRGWQESTMVFLIPPPPHLPTYAQMSVLHLTMPRPTSPLLLYLQFALSNPPNIALLLAPLPRFPILMYDGHAYQSTRSSWTAPRCKQGLRVTPLLRVIVNNQSQPRRMLESSAKSFGSWTLSLALTLKSGFVLRVYDSVQIWLSSFCVPRIRAATRASQGENHRQKPRM